MTAKRVLVIGSGIVGASVAWHLAKLGAKVTVLDGAEPGGLATRNSWGWINASAGSAELYFRLRVRSMTEWGRLDREVPGLAVNWCGGLIWDRSPDMLDAFALEHSGWGYGIRRVTHDEILALEPNLKIVPGHGFHVAGEGATEPLAAAQALLAGAEAHGVEVFGQMRAKWLLEEGGRVIGALTDEGPIHADETVVAAGVGAVQLLDSIGIEFKMKASVGILIHCKPAPELLRGLVMTPGLHVRQSTAGRLVAGSGMDDGDPMGRADEMAARLLAKVQALVRGAETVTLDFHTTGYRPMLADGLPAIGRISRSDGLYVAVTHSGVTLAPVIGLLVAQELVAGARDPMLDICDPARPIIAG